MNAVNVRLAAELMAIRRGARPRDADDANYSFQETNPISATCNNCKGQWQLLSMRPSPLPSTAIREAARLGRSRHEETVAPNVFARHDGVERTRTAGLSKVKQIRVTKWRTAHLARHVFLVGWGITRTFPIAILKIDSPKSEKLIEA